MSIGAALARSCTAAAHHACHSRVGGLCRVQRLLLTEWTLSVRQEGARLQLKRGQFNCGLELALLLAEVRRRSCDPGPCSYILLNLGQGI